MPTVRPARSRLATNENDENGISTRVTRAKAAALAAPEDGTGITAAAKKPLQTKKTTSTTAATAAAQRRRAALGDVSNVTKIDGAEAGKEGKKAVQRVGLVSKASQSAGVQKPATRTNSSRSVLGSKEHNKRASSAELKRPASGSGVLTGVQKKRNKTATATEPIQEEQQPKQENVDPTKKQGFSVEIKPRATTEPKEETASKADGQDLKQRVKQEVQDELKQEMKERLKQEMKEEAHEEVESFKDAFARGVPDLDAEDLEDPLMVAEYVVEIFDYLKALEEPTAPNPDYMEHQEELEWKMRGILVDWLIEVHMRFHLLPETLFLAVNVIDRFLSQKIVQLDRLQLVGVTAMFIASKYEEVLSPHVANFRHVADDAFSEAEILGAERFVLSTLNYDLSYPNPMNFLRRISKAENYDIQTRTLGKYLLEIGLVDHRFLGYNPSHVSAAAMYLARLILERGEWDATLAHYSGYTEKEIQPVFKLMVDYLHGPVMHEAFFKKYASKRFLKASILCRQWAKKYHPIYLDNPLSEEVDGEQK
ncbi:G2/M-specific cyclin NimE [Xylona heveae TC161]|uniref:G2/M-specific cyclin NimE n=1 Tax=Xylona heveae (strain CBS 132557 / TC161) TaxID=1328760 RepID=A0A165GL58_XYLHT|nr:G2/M-specific cyclin NimE [Xylona heveae TC161]KZF22323.1 G2/M-specific cyclin NimE [Xylona heveae TC161]